MNYKVKYKSKNSLFWTTLKEVRGDGVMQDSPIAFRYFILADESRVEVPMDGTIFTFSKERHFLIKENMNKEMGKI